MNKIIMSNDSIKLDINNSIDCEYINDELIKKINIKILEDTRLEIVIKEDIKLDINIELNKNVVCNLLEIKETNKLKIQTKYIIKENSTLNITKLHDVDSIFERNLVNLKEKNSTVNFILKTISNENEKYDININHHAINTNSNVINNGVNLNGSLDFNVTTTVLKGIKNCNIEQNNRIINLNNNKCTIRPILLIDELDVNASHSALIGDFTDSEYFYIERLGIDRNLVTKLLLEGFIKSNCLYQRQLIKMFNKYWG